MPRVFVPAAAPPSVALTPQEAHHLARVLRARAGDRVVVFDGEGHEWDGRIATITSHAAAVDLVAPRVPAAEPPVRVVLGIALLKGDQMDAVVRDATMLGVAAIQPLVSAHVTVPERARSERSIDRWTRVAIAAAKQCGRATVPPVHALARVEDVVRAHRGDTMIVCAEPALGRRGEVAAIARPASALLLIGPEGGWSEEELGAMLAEGAVAIDLGPRTLRAETAPTVALSALWTVWGWR